MDFLLFSALTSGGLAALAMILGPGTHFDPRSFNSSLIHLSLGPVALLPQHLGYAAVTICTGVPLGILQWNMLSVVTVIVSQPPSSNRHLL